MAKGIIYSISAFIIGSLILSFAIVIFTHAQSTETRATEINLMNRVYDLEMSLSNTIRTAFRNNAGITITIVNSTVEITDSLSNDNLQSFRNKISSLKTFVENDTKYVKIGDSNISNVPLMINPYNITYKRSSLGAKIVKLSDGGNTNKYKSIMIILSVNSNPGSISWDSTTPGSIPVTVTAKGSSGQTTDSRNLDMNSTNLLSVKSDTNAIIAYINISRTSISIENKESASIGIDTKLSLINKTRVAVVYPRIIKVSFPEFKLYSVYDARLD